MTAAAFCIRRAAIEDAQILSELEKVCFPAKPWSLEAMKEFLENPCARAFLLETNGAAVGFSCMYCLTGEAEIADLAVLPTHRSHGFGAALLQKMLDTAEETGSADNIFLEVREHNVQAIHLYEKAGFVPYGVRKRYYHKPTEDAILMVRSAI